MAVGAPAGDMHKIGMAGNWCQIRIKTGVPIGIGVPAGDRDEIRVAGNFCCQIRISGREGR